MSRLINFSWTLSSSNYTSPLSVQYFSLGYFDWNIYFRTIIICYLKQIIRILSRQILSFSWLCYSHELPLTFIAWIELKACIEIWSLLASLSATCQSNHYIFHIIITSYLLYAIFEYIISPVNWRLPPTSIVGLFFYVNYLNVINIFYHSVIIQIFLLAHLFVSYYSSASGFLSPSV